jgi:hypothetical protein
MAAAIDFYGGLGASLTGLGSSGIGFYGATFGSSVQVSSYQDSTFITNSNGTVNGGQIDNNKYLGNTSGVSVNGGTAEMLSGVPTTSGTLNVRFTFDSVVMTQNGQFRIMDRVSADAPASGVTSQVAQLVNGGSGVNQSTGAAQASHNGWMALAGSGTTMTLLSSPGSGGLSPNGTGTTDTRHDWYLAMSASPSSIGSKTSFGGYCSLEYL